MPQPSPIWIEVQVGPDGLYWAQFASAVLLRPYDALTKFRLGWNPGSLIEEGLNRQLLFLEAQYVQEWYPGLATEADERRLMIRYTHTPGRQELAMVLIGMVCAETEGIAKAKAHEYWEEIVSIIPYDYALRPAILQTDFRAACYPELIGNIHEAGDVVEIRRYANELRCKTRALVFPGQWHRTTVANEQIWRALGGCSKPVILQVTLQPVALREDERAWMLAQGLASLNVAQDENENALTRKYAEYAARIYTEQAQSYRNLFLEQVLLAAPGGVPGYICRAIGASFTHGEDRPAPLPGYQVFEVGLAGQDYLQGDVMPWSQGAGSSIYNRVAYLMSAQEAHVAFRLPYPSAGGIPGVCFEYEDKK